MVDQIRVGSRGYLCSPTMAIQVLPDAPTFFSWLWQTLVKAQFQPTLDIWVYLFRVGQKTKWNYPDFSKACQLFHNVHSDSQVFHDVYSDFSCLFHDTSLALLDVSRRLRHLSLVDSIPWKCSCSVSIQSDERHLTTQFQSRLLFGKDYGASLSSLLLPVSRYFSRLVRSFTPPIPSGLPWKCLCFKGIKSDKKRPIFLFEGRLLFE